MSTETAEVQNEVAPEVSATPEAPAAPESVAAAPASSDTPAVESKEAPAADPIKADLPLADKLKAIADKKTATPGTEETKVAPEAVKEPEAYKPQPKFKVMDKEYEIPKELMSVMKDASSEKMVRELCEKAQGLDVLKPRFAEVRNERNAFAQEASELKSSIADVAKIYQSAVSSGNYHKLDGFFSKLNIPQEVVLNYALEKVKLNQMPPEQRTALLSQLEAEKRADALASQQAQTVTREQQLQAENVELQLNLALGHPDTMSVASQFDEKMGKSGAFRDAVILGAELEFYRTGKVLSPLEAIAKIAQGYNLAPQAPGSVQTPAAAPSQAAPAATPAGQGSGPAGKPIVQRTTTTLPNINSRTASPVGTKGPRSIEDLKKVFQDKYAQQ